MLELSHFEPAAALALPAVMTLFRPSRAKLSIMAQLRVRPMTAPEIGRSLKMDRAAAFRHLDVLVASGLVERQEDPKRKWVYYRLSPTTPAQLEQAGLRLPPATPKRQRAANQSREQKPNTEDGAGQGSEDEKH